MKNTLKIAISLRIVIFGVAVMGLSLSYAIQKKWANDFGHRSERRSSLTHVKKIMNYKDPTDKKNLISNGVTTREFGNEALNDVVRWDDVWIDH